MRRLTLGPMIVTCAAGAVLPLMLIPLAKGATSPSVALLGVAFIVSTFFISAKNVQSVSLRQLITPTWALGRVSATAWFLVLGTLPVGAYAGGIAGELWRTTVAQLVVTLMPPSSWLVLVASRIPRLRTKPRVDEQYWASVLTWMSWTQLSHRRSTRTLPT